ncbi:MAG: DNA polymerase III subunit gamma/tau [Elusimicrobiaceae bacterium]|nr:DNA polymerase III subunit gamma/tau [Elusimicrobiaceae bacterium]
MEENSPYISLANKYRPQTFEDMVGQESISKTLQNALKLGRIAHAYLFYGPRGCGKTTTARILAKALNCTGNGATKPTAEPCGKCPQCLEIAQSGDLDVLELDAASNTQVEKVREAIIDTVALAASRDRFKVFILDEVHMLSASSFNALLKTIEEPPAHVVFILATTEKHKVPATIVSRCQTFRFRPLTVEEITTHLLDLSGAENIDLTANAAKIIAKNAGGAMRDALTLLDRAIAFCGNRIDEKMVGEMLGLTPEDLIKQAISALIQKDNAALHQVFETIQAEGFDANAFLKDIKNALGEAFYFSLGQGAEPFEGARQILAEVSPGFLAQLSRKINKIVEEVKFSDNALISAEVGLFTVMDSCLDIERLVRRLEALERGEQTTPTSGGESSFTKKAATPRQTPISAKPKPLQAAATPQPQEELPSSVQQTISNQQLWEKMLQYFEKSPFVYDVMLNGSVQFNGDDWTLRFSQDKAFYQIPAQSKIAELEAAAKNLSGRKVKISLAVEEASSAAPAAKKEPKKKTKSTPVAAKQVEILDEEPLTSTSLQTAVVSSDQKGALEEVKEILDVIPGELLA